MNKVANTPEFDKFLRRMLTPIQYKCYTYYYFDNLTQKEIGKKLNLCQPNVSNYLKTANERINPALELATTIYNKAMDYRNQKIKDFNAPVISKSLRELRKERRLTQKEVSKMLGVDTRTFQNIERGTSKLKVSHLIKLANIYEVSIDRILKG